MLKGKVHKCGADIFVLRYLIEAQSGRQEVTLDG